MKSKIIIEQDINFNKSIDISVYKDGKLLEYYQDCPYNSVAEIIEKVKEENKDSIVEHFCSGELCIGGWMRWEVE